MVNIELQVLELAKTYLAKQNSKSAARERIATAVLQSMITVTPQVEPQDLAKSAVEYADALLAALGEKD